MNKKEIQALTEKINGKMTAIASTEAVDRVGDSIKVRDWDFKNFKRNPVLQAGHDYHPLSTIGIAKNIRIKDNQVIFEPMFHEITSLAREIKKMYEDGYLTAWSVGFIPAQEEGGKHELLEVSAVAVPANAEALTTLSQKSIKNATIDDEKKIDDFIKKSIDDKIEINQDNIEESVEEIIEEIEETLEDKVEEKENKVDTIEEQLSDDDKRKKKWDNLSKVDKIIYAFYQVYLQEEKEVESFKELLNEAIGLLTNVVKSKKEFDKKELKDFTGSMVDILERKEGKVISKKNREVITKTVENLNNTVEALEKLLTLSNDSKELEIVDTPENAIKNDEIKVDEKTQIRKAQKSKYTQENIAVRILQQINKQSSYGLNKIKNK